jgi:chromosome segregation ATPase
MSSCALVKLAGLFLHQAEQERRRTRDEVLELEERSNFHEQRADSAVHRIESLEEQMRTTQIDVQRMDALSSEINIKHTSLVDSLR